MILTTLLYTFPQSIDIAGGLDPSSYYFISSQRREADDERRSLSGRGGSKLVYMSPLSAYTFIRYNKYSQLVCA